MWAKVDIQPTCNPTTGPQWGIQLSTLLTRIHLRSLWTQSIDVPLSLVLFPSPLTVYSMLLHQMSFVLMFPVSLHSCAIMHLFLSPLGYRYGTSVICILYIFLAVWSSFQLYHLVLLFLINVIDFSCTLCIIFYPSLYSLLTAWYCYSQLCYIVLMVYYLIIISSIPPVFPFFLSFSLL